MSAFWPSLNQQWKRVADDFHEKGAISSFWDVALDVKDVLQDTRDAIAKPKLWFSNCQREISIPLCDGEAPPLGTRLLLNEPDGSFSEAEILAIDTISIPWRARVRLQSTGEELVVALLNANDATAGGEKESINNGAMVTAGWVMREFGDQVHYTVEDMRQKGAAGAFKDAALDAMDIFRDGASIAYTKARSVMISSTDNMLSKKPDAPPAVHILAGCETVRNGATQQEEIAEEEEELID